MRTRIVRSLYSAKHIIFKKNYLRNFHYFRARQPVVINFFHERLVCMNDRPVPVLEHKKSNEQLERKNSNVKLERKNSVPVLERPKSLDSSERKREISYGQMSNKTLNELDDKGIFQVGFARKKITYFYHSAVVFLDIHAKPTETAYLLMGRQAQYYLNKNEIKKEQGNFFSNISNLFHSFVDTTIDNEKKYDFFKNNPFVAEMSTALLTGAEVKKIVKQADQAICEHHMYNLVGSNCYSASVSILVNAMEAISTRQETSETDKENNTVFLTELYRLLTHADKDNFSIGVKNNVIVEKALQKAEQIIERRGLNDLNIEEEPENSSKIR